MTKIAQNHPHIKIIILRLLILLLSIALAVFFLESSYIRHLLEYAKGWEYIGSFISGIFFTSTFTALPATTVLFILGKRHNPFLISLTAALGAMVSDNLLLKFIKSEFEKNLYSFVIPSQTRALRKLLHTRAVYWMVAILAILVIASPLPDELGISMLSVIHFRVRHFLVISFIVNFVGIFIITSIARTG